MHIVIINRNWAQGGGVERYLQNVVRDLSNLSHNVTVIYSRGEADWEDQHFKAYKVKGIDTCDGQYMRSLSDILTNVKPDLVFIHNTPNYQLVDYVAANWPSVRMVHDHELYCWRPSRMLRPSKVICTKSFGPMCCTLCALTRDTKARSGFSLRNYRRKLIELEATRRVSKIVVASKYMRDELLRNSFAKESLEILPCYAPDPKSGRTRIHTEQRTILFVGRILDIKGISPLIKAFASVDTDASLMIVGDGAYLSKAKKVAHRLKLERRVRFAGWLDDTETSECYQAAQLVVIPSLWPEPFGIVGIEAMAHGKAVIAYNVGGISDWLEDGVNGYLVRRGRISDLSLVINELLRNSQLRERLGLNGRRLFEEKYTSKVHLTALLRIFGEAVDAFGISRERFEHNEVDSATS